VAGVAISSFALVSAGVCSSSREARGIGVAGVLDLVNG
jgi:hypothetical protein